MKTFCPFCKLDQSQFVADNNSAYASLDAFPVAKGHTLVVPKRHIASLFDLADEELAAVWRLVSSVRSNLMTQFSPDAFNIGVNDGTAAGQTVGHAHVHVIPRYKGDVADPRGGIRWIIPEKAPYWNEGHE